MTYPFSQKVGIVLLLIMITLAIAALSSCSTDDSLSNLPGQIVYEAAFREAFIPATNTRISYDRGSGDFNVWPVGGWLGDTIILMTQTPWPGLSDEDVGLERDGYYYKWSPSNESLTPCGATQLIDSSRLVINLESQSLLALCYSTREPFYYSLVSLDSNLTIQYAVAQFAPSIRGKRLSRVFLAFGGIIHEYMLDSLYYQTIKGDTLGPVKLIGQGIIGDVSRQGNLIAYEAYSASGETLIIHNLLSGKAEIIESMPNLGGVCFSPDGCYLAYSEIGSGLISKAYLRIYSVHDREILETGIDNAFGELLWVATPE